MKRKASILIMCLVLALLAGTVQAAFLIEAHSSGLANANFSTNSGIIYTSDPSNAYGRRATSSIFGGSVNPDTYTYTYTPGMDLDNVPIPAGINLGNGDLASGLDGNGIWPYNVYITWPASTNVNAAGCKLIITNDGTDVELDPVNMNTNGTGTPGGNNAWYRIAENIRLTPGLSYTVTQIANSTAYCSQRSHGVLWEMRTPETFAPVIITELDGFTEVQEGGNNDTYTVALGEEPDPCSTVVTVTVMVSPDPNQLIVNGGFGATPVVLMFDHDNWMDPQTVTVKAIDDDDMEGDQTVWLYHVVDSDWPDDAAYAKAYAPRVGVKILDNEIQDIRITHDDTSTAVSEQGPTSDTYFVRLLFEPAASVTINIETDGQTVVDTGSGAATTGQLLFTTTNWGTEQPVTVTAVDDAVFEGTHLSTINHHSTSADPDSNNLDRNWDVTVEDNDCGLWGFHPMDFTGPAGRPDCVVNLYDYAEFALAWLFCTQPYEPGCENLLE
ncbi:MAG: hypothetical protein JW810_04665 [Sedimentisphaerales bacterium]|nr:hypothetical protein [Sedimentisphaerales bacterium]